MNTDVACWFAIALIVLSISSCSVAHKYIDHAYAHKPCTEVAK